MPASTLPDKPGDQQLGSKFTPIKNRSGVLETTGSMCPVQTTWPSPSSGPQAAVSPGFSGRSPNQHLNVKSSKNFLSTSNKHRHVKYTNQQTGALSCVLQMLRHQAVGSTVLVGPEQDSPRLPKLSLGEQSHSTWEQIPLSCPATNHLDWPLYYVPV